MGGFGVGGRPVERGGVVAADTVVVLACGGNALFGGVQQRLSLRLAVRLAIGIVAIVLLDVTGAVGDHHHRTLVVGMEVVRGSLAVKVASWEIAVGRAVVYRHPSRFIVAAVENNSPGTFIGACNERPEAS